MIDREKKEQIEKKMLIDALNNMPTQVIATAYLHALNYHLYGVDVTEKWETAVQNTANVENAYLKGRRDEAEFQINVKLGEGDQLSSSAVFDLCKKYEALVVPELADFSYELETAPSREATLEFFNAFQTTLLDYVSKFSYELESLPTVRGPKYTLEGAIEYLDSIGWLRKHDREMMLDGIRRYAEDPDLAAIKASALQAGFEGEEVRFYIGGRLFAIRELPG